MSSYVANAKAYQDAIDDLKDDMDTFLVFAKAVPGAYVTKKQFKQIIDQVTEVVECFVLVVL